MRQLLARMPVVLLICAMILSSAPVYALPVEDVQSQGLGSDDAIVISDFELGDDGWVIHSGDDQPNLIYSFTREGDGGAYADDYYGRLYSDYSSANPANNAYAGIIKYIGLEISQLSFWVKTTDLAAIKIRTIEGSGETFQHRIELQNTSDWQEINLTQLSASAHWGGNDDGVWDGTLGALFVMVDRQDVTNPNQEATFLIDQVTYPGTVEADLGMVVEDFESGNSSWDIAIGDNQPNMQGQFERIQSTVAYAGDYVGQLSGDFLNANLANAGYVSLSQKFLGLDVSKLSFRVKTIDMNEVIVRVIDSTGQTFQHKMYLKAIADWQLIKLDQLTSNLYWNGAADGVWHGPLDTVQILIDRAGVISENKTGSILIDQLTTNLPALAVGQNQLGNIYTVDEDVSFPIYSTGDELLWNVTDFWGNIVAQGTAEPTDGRTVLSFPDLDIQYYELHVKAMSSGILLKAVDIAFAVIGPSPDLHQIEESPFGVMTHFAHNMWKESSHPLELIELVEKAGIKNIRDEVRWDAVEQVKGQYSFPELYERYMQEAKDRGIDPFLIFGFENPYYDDRHTPHSAEGLTGYANYADAVLDHYNNDNDTMIKWAEVWNEYNIPVFSNGVCAQDTQCYYEMLKITYNKLKTEHPEVKVLGPGSAGIPWAWLEELFSRGDNDGRMLDYLDGVSIHPYSYPNSPNGLEDNIARLQSLIKENNNGDPKPIWVSEWGWPTHEGATGVSVNTEASYLVQSTARLLAANVEKMYWYTLIDMGLDSSYSEDNFGLLRNPRSVMGKYAPKPAYVAYAALTRVMEDASYAETEQDGDVSSYLFDKNDSPLRVMWAKEPTVMSLATTSPLVITDVMGHEQILEPTNGEVIYTLTNYPIYVEGAITDIQENETYSMSASDASIGEQVEVTFQLDNTGSNSPLTAEIRFLGQSYELTAEAGHIAQRIVYAPGYDAERTLTLTAEVFVNGHKAAVLASVSRIIAPLHAEIRHIIVDDHNQLNLVLTNRSAQTKLLERINWDIGAFNGSTELNLEVTGQSSTIYPLELPDLTVGTGYDYQFTLLWEDGQSMQLKGRLVLADPEHLTPIMKKNVTFPQNLTQLSASPTIEFGTDGNFDNLTDYGGSSDLDGQVWMNWDEGHLYLSASIKDNVHHQSYSGGDIWGSDSIQFALSAGTPGEYTKMYEYGMALTPQGAQLYRWSSMNGSPSGLIQSGVGLVITRDDQTAVTEYQLALPWSDISPIDPADALLSMSLLVNDDDGNGRKGWMEWGAGIGQEKNPALFNGMKLLPAIPVEDITVAGAGGATTIATSGGTLQMNATVLPSLATNAAVTWTVTGEDGAATDKATIDANGRLTAVKNGNVKVVATAQDGSGVTGFAIVAISGQSSSGSGSGNGTGSGTVTTPVTKPVLGVQDGKVIAKLANGEIKFTIEASELKKVGALPLTATSSGVTLAIPAAVTQQLLKKLEMSDNARVQILIVPNAAVTTPAVGSGYTIGEQTYQLNVIVLDHDGQQLPLDSLAEPVTITLPYRTGQWNEQLLGVYYYDESDRAWRYVGGRVDLSSNTITATLSQWGSFAVMSYDKAYADVAGGHWANEAIKVLAAKHLINGVSDSLFLPNGQTTRAEFTAMLVRLLGLEALGQSDVFTDVKDQVWYASAINTAHQAGLIQGVAGGKFEPEAAITREQMAVLLIKAYEYMHGIIGAEQRNLHTYQDNAGISSWAKEAVNKATSAGLLQGKKNGTFDPKTSTTRAEAAQAIFNLVKLLHM